VAGNARRRSPSRKNNICKAGMAVILNQRGAVYKLEMIDELAAAIA
jgi:hypothetical protein